MKTQNRLSKRIWIIILVALPILCAATVFAVTYPASAGSSDVQTDTLSEPLNGITAAKMNIDTGDGNLTVDWLTGGEPLLAGGTLQYLENIGLPARTLTIFGEKATYLLEAGKGGQRWIMFAIHPRQKHSDMAIECHAPIKDRRLVSDSGGHKQRRYVIETRLILGQSIITAEMTLTNRDTMLFRMLIGRTTMSNRFIIDPSASYLQGKPTTI